MINIIIGFFIFCIVLFFYLHIQFHLKTSNDLEIYEVEYPSKEAIEEICDLRQPVLFNMDDDNSNAIINNTNKDYMLKRYSTFDINIRNYPNITEDIELYLPVHLSIANELFNKDKKSMYYSENNMEYLTETGIIKNFTHNDTFLRPYLVSNCDYDIMLGSTNTITPLKYEINYRTFFMITQGSIDVKLIPPNSSKYLHQNKDYEHFEFSSPINVWSIQPKYETDFDKIKSLEITLTPGKILFIPAYWWYSFKFSPETSISCFRYRTYVNNIVISPNIFMYALQNQNIQKKFTKTSTDNTLLNTIHNSKIAIVEPTNDILQTTSTSISTNNNENNENKQLDNSNVISIDAKNVKFTEDDISKTDNSSQNEKN